MKKYLFLPLLVSLSPACVWTKVDIPELGLRVGDEFELASEAVIYRCNTWENTASVWLGGAPETQCLKAILRTDIGDDAARSVPAGTRVVVRKVKRRNLYESADHLIYVQASDWPDAIIVRDFELGKLRGGSNDP